MILEPLRGERASTARQLREAQAQGRAGPRDPMALGELELQVAVLDHAIDLFTRLPLQVAVGHVRNCSAEPCPQIRSYGFHADRVREIVAATLTRALEVLPGQDELAVPHLRTRDGTPWTEAMTRAAFDPTAAQRPTDWPTGIAVPPGRTAELAEAAIETFLQLRDTHGLSEQAARPQAVSATLRREAERERDAAASAAIHANHHWGVEPTAKRQPPDLRPGAYYVSVRDGDRWDVLAGPWRTHQPALDQVEPAKRLTIQLRPMAAFYAYGTCRLDPGDQPLPVGKLNDRLGLVVDSGGYITATYSDDLAVPHLRTRDGKPWTDAMTRAVFDPTAADRPSDLPRNLAVPQQRARTLADDAIGLFVEYRDVHGHDEPAARAWAVTEVVDGEAAREELEWLVRYRELPHGPVPVEVVRDDPAIDTDDGLAVP